MRAQQSHANLRAVLQKLRPSPRWRMVTRDTDPRRLSTRRFMIKIPRTPRCQPVRRNPCPAPLTPNAASKSPSLKAIGLLSMSCLFSMLCTCFVFRGSVVPDSLRPHGQQPARLLCLWGFSRQEHGSRLPRPPPGGRPNPGIEPRAPALPADSLLPEPPGKPCEWRLKINAALFLTTACCQQTDWLCC